ncbi:MAG: serine--tRNA ligase [Endomicrobium sp.]|jgi:seryl-tRNA synthetase|nr:serine--tRNA ligase [Endomicrobium sp.]
MLDIKFIRKNIELVKKALLCRNENIDIEQLLYLDDEKKKILKSIEKLNNYRNKKSKEISRFIKNKEKNYDLTRLISVANTLKNNIQKQKKRLFVLEDKILKLILCIPNIPDISVPIGIDEKSNKIVKLVNTPKKFSFHPKHHWEIGEKLNIFDFVVASKISGSRFVVLKNEGCVLERALITFFIETHKKNNYSEITAPYLVNLESMIGTGQLPKFNDEVFKCAMDNLYLIPTAEVSITNVYRNKILLENSLPKKFVSYSACFRRESGSYGRDTKGLFRNHQFGKVELVKFVNPTTSNYELDTLVLDVENVLKPLDIPYRISLLSSGDMGFAAAKTYDLEIWFAGDNKYKEVSSCSNFKDFQARRMNIKIKHINKKNNFIHTLNGSGVAIGRIMAAIIEYYQQEDGTIKIPKVLRKYTGFNHISSNKSF